MRLKAYLRIALQSILNRFNYVIINNRQLQYYKNLESNLYEWQKNPQTEPSYNQSELPIGSEEYLQVSNPRLQDLQARYESFNSEVTTPLAWTEGIVKHEDVLYFRGDNAYVWQLRGPNMNIMAYALTTYYVKSIDKLGLFEQLEEDNLFGNYTFCIDNKTISRDLLDSITEIYFLEKHLNISSLKDLTVLDIGAGYGRLAHRMTKALPNVKEYLCTDGVAASSFISEYHLRFRGLEDRAKMIPLDRIENILSNKSVDLAVNIHSFSECKTAAIDWWLSLLVKSRVKYLMVVPNSGKHGGKLLRTNEGENFGAIIEKHGYRLVGKESKYRDPIVQKYAINPTYHYLFQLEDSNMG